VHKHLECLHQWFKHSGEMHRTLCRWQLGFLLTFVSRRLTDLQSHYCVYWHGRSIRHLNWLRCCTCCSVSIAHSFSASFNPFVLHSDAQWLIDNPVSTVWRGWYCWLTALVHDVNEMLIQSASCPIATASVCWFTDICSQDNWSPDKCSQHYLKYGQMLSKFIISFLYLF